jgi:hypothetical protein
VRSATTAAAAAVTPVRLAPELDEAREQELAGSDVSFVEASRRQKRPEARIRCSSIASVVGPTTDTLAVRAKQCSKGWAGQHPAE